MYVIGLLVIIAILLMMWGSEDTKVTRLEKRVDWLEEQLRILEGDGK